MRRILFLTRQFNDIDHFTPLIDACVRSGRFAVTFATPELHLLRTQNENLAYLERAHRVLLEDLLQDTALTRSDRMRRAIVTRLTMWNATAELSHVSQTVMTRTIQRCWRPLAKRYEALDDQWAERYFDRMRPDCVVFDWGSPSIFWRRAIIRAAKRRGTPTVAVPHGLNVYSSLAYSNVPLERLQQQEAMHRAQGIQYDHVVSQGPISTMHLKGEGYLDDEITALGSARFAREWLTQYPEIFQRRVLPQDGRSSVRVAVFPSKPKYNGDLAGMRALIATLAIMEGVSVYVKPHTRGMKADFLGDDTARQRIPVTYDASSLELSQWCDIGIVWGSSIGLQLLHDGKVLVDPLFADHNASIYETYGAACCVRNPEDLRALIAQYQRGEDVRTYTQESVDHLFRDAVYVGVGDHHRVLDAYVHFFERIAART